MDRYCMCQERVSCEQTYEKTFYHNHCILVLELDFKDLSLLLSHNDCSWSKPGICCYLVDELCPILCDLMDCGPPGSAVHGIPQARILEWFVISFSRGLPDSGIEPTFSRGLPDSGIEPTSLVLSCEFSVTEPPVSKMYLDWVT